MKMFRLLAMPLIAGACSGAIDGEEAARRRQIEECRGVSPLKLQVVPTRVRVGTPAVLVGSGGSGRFVYGVVKGGSGGDVRGDRFVAGKTPGVDMLWVQDAVCGGGQVMADLEVQGAFSVLPTRASIRPKTTFTIAVQGTVGTPVFALVQNQSGATLGGDGRYVAGANPGLDVIGVRDAQTGDDVALEYRVSPTARFRAVPDKLAIPSGSSVPLRTVDGTDGLVITKLSGPGVVVEGSAGRPATFALEPNAADVAEVELKDRFTGEVAKIKIRPLSELQRPATAYGRLSDVAAMVTGDFDGDKVPDVAVGMPESDLGKPQGGLVMIWKGSPQGLTPEPTWTLTGSTDTAQLGAALAVGDFDGDGKDDLAVAEPGADVTVGDSGAVELYRFTGGRPEAMRSPLSGLGRGNFGASLATADVDGDGMMDIIVGSPGADLAPTATINRRGVLDVFFLKRAVPIPDLGGLRVTGWDLAADGTLLKKAGVAAGRSLVVADLDGDDKPDLATLGTVTGMLVAGMPKAQPSIQIHFSRGGMPAFDETPDAIILPTDPADANEGTYRLLSVPRGPNRPPLLGVTIDLGDAPSLVNAGLALFFDVSRAKGAGGGGKKPMIIGRADAFARIAGDVAGVALGRSFALGDLDGDKQPELILGAPYALAPGAMPGTPPAGKIMRFPLSVLVAGAVIAKPLEQRFGGKGDVFGTALAVWDLPKATTLLVMASRATTGKGKFTGRVDAAKADKMPFEAWTAVTSEVPAAPALEGFGSVVASALVLGKPIAVVGAPLVAGIRAAMDGTEAGLGQALLYDTRTANVPNGLVEGALTPLSRGGRNVGTDVGFTDFNGDGRPDLIVGAPNFQLPGTAQRATEIVPVYANEPTGCLQAAAQAVGGVLVSLSRPDGSFAPAYRLAAPVVIADCLPATDAKCRRVGQGRGVVGGFDWNGDGKQDVATLRSGGFEIFLGRAPADETLAKLTLVCDSAFSLVSQAPATTSTLAAVGDLDGDKCDEVAVRAGPDATRGGIIIAFGADATACGGHKIPALLRVLADIEVGLPNVGLGQAIARAGKIRGDAKDVLAVSASRFPADGIVQPTVLLYDVAALAMAVRAPVPTMTMGPMPDGGLMLPQGPSMVTVPGFGDRLVPVPLVLRDRPAGFGQAMAGNVDFTGDGKPDLVISAPGASVGSEGSGAVYVFAGGTLGPLPDGSSVLVPEPAVLILGDTHERGQPGADLSLTAGGPGVPPFIVIGVPASYRTGTQNGSAFALPWRF